MKVAVHSWSFREERKAPGFNLFKLLDRTAEMGFTAIEIDTGKAWYTKGDFESTEPAYIDKVTAHARSLGIVIVALAPTNDFCYTPDEKWRLANVEHVKTWLKIAADMEVPNLRVFTGHQVKDQPVEKLEQLVINGFKECAPVAEQCKVNMALENHSSVMAKADDVLRLIRTIGSKRLTTCPDPTNFSRDPEVVYAETAKVAPLATESHIKFNGFDDKGQWANTDPKRIFGIYRKAGYDGAVAIESIYQADLLGRLADARVALEKAIADTGK